jgi:hypothetical protein
MGDAEAVDVLTAKVNELARVCARLSRENAELRGQVSALSAPAPVAGAAEPGWPGDGGAGGARISRRAAVGVALAGAAAIQLTPAGASHPKSGQRGDLFADAAGRLWYCKTTGASATWHQIA